MDIEQLKNIQKLHRDNNKLLIAGLFIILFAGWCTLLIWMVLVGSDPTAYESFGLGAVTGVLVAILKDVFQFFFRKSGTTIE